jgi:hypothetical protein
MARLMLVLVLAFALKGSASAQARAGGDTTPVPPSVFRSLALPGPNEYRTGAGRPGPSYWQQRVDYRIAATLDTARRQIQGRETIHYTNHSPGALGYLWLFVEQNICAPASVTRQLDQPPLTFLGSTFDFSCKTFMGGLTLERVSVGGRVIKPVVYGTTMRVDLPQPLPAGGVLDLEIAWHFPVPDYGAGRMGRDGSLYEIAQWYPRLAVYDDVRGWNHEPYIGAGEFYLEYGDFDVSLTVPASYVVAATGTLRNPGVVLTKEQQARLLAAHGSTEPVAVIAAAEAGRPEQTRPSSKGQLTWRYTAASVRDFAFAAGPELRWDASSYDGILIQTLYRPKAKRWEEANRMAREAIKYFSEQWYRYPYPQATTVEGPIEGMEYPMLTFVPDSPSREELQWVLSHEFGHEWFPMVVGSNERLYPWMDEGFNTFIDLAGAARYFAGTAYRSPSPAPVLRPCDGGAGATTDEPAGRGERPLLGRLPEACAHDADAALRGARQGAVRLRLSGIHQGVGIQAPHSGRLLPAHARRVRDGSRLVLARLDLHHRSPGSGSGLGGSGEDLSGKPRQHDVAARNGCDVCGWLDRTHPPAGRDVEPGHPIRLSDASR